MIAVGFDLDGTLTASPALVALANALVSLGQRAIVITAYQCPASALGPAQTAARRAQMDALQLDPRVELEIVADPDLTVIGRLKAAVCHRLTIGVIFEDSMVYAGPLRDAGITVGMVA